MKSLRNTKRKEEEAYEQKQVAIWEVIYWTIDKFMFLQVKNKSTATAIWKKVILIHADKDSMYKMNLLMQHQPIQYIENRDMQEHLTKMMEIKEQLAEMKSLVTNESFEFYICTLFSPILNY